jgi:hypothetical protein
MNSMKMIDSSLPPVTPVMGHTLIFFYTFHLKKDTKNSFKKRPEVRIKPDKMLKH